MSTWEESEDIYHGTVPVHLKHLDREERTAALTIAITHTIGQPRNQKVLHVQLTDETDPFLLYSLDLSEDDFHALKTEQSILVDFATFPSKVIDLLHQCQADAAKEHPCFVAALSMTSGAPVFTVTEINGFRQLAHLSLRCVAGNDASIKRHLAGRVTDFKAQLLTTAEQLKERTLQLHEASEVAAAQSEKLRTIEDEHARQMAELDLRLAAQLAAAKEAAAAAQQDHVTVSEQERQRLTEKSEAELSAARTAASEAAAQASQLTSANHALELKLRETESRLTGAEQEVSLLRREASQLREENSAAASRTHELEKALAAKDIEIKAAMQTLKDKDEILGKAESLQRAAAEAKDQQEDSINLYREHNTRLQEQLRLSSAEITKGNTIIAKLQSDCRELKGKLRLKAAVMLQQQEHANQRQSELDAAERSPSPPPSP